jgi:hypothetical protein
VSADETLRRVARETGELLGELGVGPSDREWIRRHAAAVASLTEPARTRPAFLERLYRLARRAARTAR